MNVDIDDLLEEIEKKEFKVKTKSKLDDRSNTNSITSSPKGDKTPPLDELKSLYPMNGPSLFPSAVNIDENKLDVKEDTPNEKEKKENVYLMAANEHLENVNRKKLRISNSVLPERKKEKIELPIYTTKYSQFIEGFSSERTGLGFSKDDESEASPKNTINYGNGLTFTKGETLNEEKKDEDLDDLTELVEAKLKFLNQLQPCSLTPLQEMLIQMQVKYVHTYISYAFLFCIFRSYLLLTTHYPFTSGSSLDKNESIPRELYIFFGMIYSL